MESVFIQKETRQFVYEDQNYGAHCEKSQGCSYPGVPSTAMKVVWTGRRPGDIATLFCTTGYKTAPMEYYICEGTKGWLLESQASCQAPTTTGPRKATTYHHIEPTIEPWLHTTESPWDKSMDWVIFFGPCLAMQAIIPCFIWLALIIFDIVKTSTRTPPNSNERIAAVGKIQKGRYFRLWRVYSGFFNLAFWIWLGFVIACAASSDFGDDHEYLMYCAVGTCIFCAIFVAIEGCYCKERTALQKVVTWKYIQHLHSLPPIVQMVVERFKMKEVQSGGLHTNPTTGHIEYRQQIDRKVGRKFVREPFVFDSWYDTSNTDYIYEGKLTLLHLNVVVNLENDSTRVSFEEQKEAFIRKTGHVGPSYNFSRVDTVQNFHKHIILYSTFLPFWIKEEYFWLATFLQLSWLYRIFLSLSTTHGEHTVCKSVCNKCKGNGTQDTTSTGNVIPYQPSANMTPNTPLADGSNGHRNYMTM